MGFAIEKTNYLKKQNKLKTNQIKNKNKYDILRILNDGLISGGAMPHFFCLCSQLYGK